MKIWTGGLVGLLIGMVVWGVVLAAYEGGTGLEPPGLSTLDIQQMRTEQSLQQSERGRQWQRLFEKRGPC